MEVLISIALFFAAGIAGGSLTTIFLFAAGGPDREDFHASRGLSFYGLWLRDRYSKHEAKVDAEIHQMEKRVLEEPGDIDARMLKVGKLANFIRAKRLNYYKPLGMCGYCTATWLSAGTGFLFFLLLDMPVWLTLFVPGVGSITYALTRPHLP